MALGLTEQLTEMSTWGGEGGLKAAVGVRLTTLPPSCDSCLEILVATAWPALNMKQLLSFETLKWLLLCA